MTLSGQDHSTPNLRHFPVTLRARGVCSRISHFADLCRHVHLSLCRGGYRNYFRFDLFPEIGKEIHLKGLRQAHCRSECDIDVAGEEFRDIRTGHFHALRQLGLIEPQPLHLNDDAPQECTDQVVRCHKEQCNIFVTDKARMSDLKFTVNDISLLRSALQCP